MAAPHRAVHSAWARFTGLLATNTIACTTRSASESLRKRSRSRGRISAIIFNRCAAESIPGLEFWNVRKHSLGEIWLAAPAFNAFRGTAFLPEPCASCERRELDFGGCRCQAFALTGDARATDPVCHLSPRHGLVIELAEADPGGNMSYQVTMKDVEARPTAVVPE